MYGTCRYVFSAERSLALTQLRRSVALLRHGAFARAWVSWADLSAALAIPRKALFRWRAQELARCLGAWLGHVQLRNRVKRPAAAAHVVALFRALTRYFRYWRESRAVYVKARRAMTKWHSTTKYLAFDKMRSVAAHERAKSYALYETSGAVRSLRKRRCLLTWREHAAVVAEARMFKRAVKRCMHSEVAKGWLAWADYADARLEATQTIRRALGKLMARETGRAYLQWADAAYAAIDAKRQLLDAATTLSRFEVTRAWRSLLEHWEEAVHARAVRSHVLLRMGSLSLSKGWNTYVAYVADRKEASRQMRGVVMKLLHSSLHRAFQTLVADAGARAALRGVVMRLVLAQLHRAFQTYKEVAAKCAWRATTTRGVIMKLLHANVHRAFQTYRAAAQEAAWRVATLRGVLMKLLHSQLHRAFQSFAALVQRASWRTSTSGRMILRIMHRAVSRALTKWHADTAVASATGRAMRGAVHKMLNQQLLVGWNGWRDAAVKRGRSMALLQRVVQRDLWQALTSWHQKAAGTVRALSMIERAFLFIRRSDLTRGWLTLRAYTADRIAAMETIDTAYRRLYHAGAASRDAHRAVHSVGASAHRSRPCIARACLCDAGTPSPPARPGGSGRWPWRTRSPRRPSTRRSRTWAASSCCAAGARGGSRCCSTGGSSPPFAGGRTARTRRRAARSGGSSCARRRRAG